MLIPLTTDQPIQAELLKLSQAGAAIYPHEISEEKFYAAFQQLLDKHDPIHQRIKITQALFQNSYGEKTVADLIEKLASH